MFLIHGRSAQVVRIAERHPQLTLIVDHMGCDGGCRESRQVGGRDRSGAVACQVSECFRQAVISSQLFNGVLSLP
jgi:hypothetical protein